MRRTEEEGKEGRASGREEELEFFFSLVVRGDLVAGKGGVSR